MTPIKWLQKQPSEYNDFFVNEEKTAQALDYAKKYTDKYHVLIKNTWNLVNKENKGITICSFGSPSRFEMLGESDLDCMIFHEDDVDISADRDKFIKILNEYGFSKIDIPKWGSISESKNFIKHAITEGNQVIESRYISGDLNTWDKIKNLKEKYATKEKSRATFLFQYLYFEQYYQQRVRNNQINLKYGHGGTRDFLFPVWFGTFREGHKYFDEEKPAVIKGIDSLASRGNLSVTQIQEFSKSANIIAHLRNELLIQSKGTEDSGLTYLGEDTAKNIFLSNKNIYSSSQHVLKTGLENAKKIKELKDICYATYMNEPDVKERIGPKTKLDPGEELSAILLSWTSNLSNIKDNTISDLLNTNKWTVLTSIACNPTCPSEVLHELSKFGQTQGFEYLLKVVGRNQNTTNNTLSYISESSAELRFKEPAITRLTKGWKKANELH